MSTIIIASGGLPIHFVDSSVFVQYSSYSDSGDYNLQMLISQDRTPTKLKFRLVFPTWLLLMVLFIVLASVLSMMLPIPTSRVH